MNFLFRLAADTTPDQYRDIQFLLTESPSAVLITNSVSLGQWPVALGAPGRRPRRWIAVGANPVTLPSVDTTPFGPVPASRDTDAQAANLAGWRNFDAMLEPSRQRMQTVATRWARQIRYPDSRRGWRPSLTTSPR